MTTMATEYFPKCHSSLDFIIRTYTFPLFKKSSQENYIDSRTDITLRMPTTPAPRNLKDEARKTLLSALRRMKELQALHEAAQGGDDHTCALRLKEHTKLIADIRDSIKSALERLDELTSTRPQHRPDIANGKLKRVAEDVVRLLIMLENVHFNYSNYFERRNGQIIHADIGMRAEWEVHEMVKGYLERIEYRLRDVRIV